MTIGIFTLVLIAALCHAIWNTIIKLSPDKSLETSLMNLSGSLIALPFFIYLGLPKAEVWSFLFASICLHVIYYYSLSSAYKFGEMSLTYPIMRGMAPIFLVCITFLFSHEELSSITVLSIFLISLGVIFLGLGSIRAQEYKKAIFFAILNACVIAGYTFFDGMGVRKSDDVLSYIAIFTLIDGFVYSSLVLFRRKLSPRNIKIYIQERWVYFSSGALLTTTSYGIALWAISVAPISLVSALRELSVLFAVLISVLFLKEKLNHLKISGIGLIIIGLVSLRLITL